MLRLLSAALRSGVVVYTAKSVAKGISNRRRPAAVLTKQAAEQSHEKIVIVTTAAIPWRTGTAVNPCLRAAHLAALTNHEVILVVPFIPVQDQELIFPEGVTCSSTAEQEAIIKAWAREHSGLPPGSKDFSVLFYNARYYPASRCIFAAEDIPKLLPKEQVCLVLLEEPEHLNWYRASGRWSHQFDHVVGVLHTHYSGYAADLPGGPINAAAVGLVCRVVCRLHCHKVVQLSELAKHLARSTVVNVHGVSAKFLEVGQQTAARLRQQQQQAHTAGGARQLHLQGKQLRNEGEQGQDEQQQQQQQQLLLARQGAGASQVSQPSCFSKGAYFLGKALWDKGHGHLMDLLAAHDKEHKQQVSVDVFGNGPDLEAIRAEASRRGLPLVFKGQADHCSSELQEYKVFINCCRKDVLATATAEAVAMNKWAILPDVACNQFFKAFPNVLLFGSAAGFSRALVTAMEQDPPPLSSEHLRQLSWAAATERLLAAASIDAKEWPGAASQALDDCLWVPYRLFALLFTGARNAFAAPPKLAAEQQPQLQQQELQSAELLLTTPQ